MSDVVYDDQGGMYELGGGYMDPLELMLRKEGNAGEADVLASMYDSAQHVARSTHREQPARDELEPVTHVNWVHHSSFIQ